MLRTLNGRPVHCFPALARRNLIRILRQQAGVALVPLRAFPADAFEEVPAEFLERRVIRSQAHVARMLHLLHRVDDVVNFAVLLCRCAHGVILALGMLVETAGVALVDITGRVAFRHPFGNRFAHATGVRYPYPDSRPEVIPLRRPHNGVAVNRKREHTVERGHIFFAAHGRQ